MALAKEKPVDKITVKEIVDRCQINRNSFYYHFQDLPDLIESIFEDQLNEEVSHHANEGVTAVLLGAIEILEGEHDICRNIYYSKNRDILFMRISRMVTRIVEDSLKKRICLVTLSQMKTLRLSFSYIEWKSPDLFWTGSMQA